jgi:hypothetical protein
MATTLSEKKIATGNAQVLDTVLAPITKSRRNRLVARWLTDENSKLYCQWGIEDEVNISS